MKRNVYGVTGYPTPDATTESICRTFNIPNSTLALGAFMGALWPLANPEAWQEYGDMTAQESADMIQNILWEVMLGENDECRVVDTPFWDETSGDDSDDTAPATDQRWYGQLVLVDDELTFVENAFIYVVAGFIAYAGLPTAAISFVPIARNFVVTMKTNPLGGIVRFLQDGLELTRVDTYSTSDGVIEVPLQMPAPAMGFVAEDVTYPTLWLELLADNPHELASVSMTLIRSRLNPNNFSPTNLRYNPDTDTVQQTYDGGSTWVDQPGQDPRSSPQFQFPPVGGDDPQCQAAANMTRYVENVIGETLTNLSLGLDALGVATSLLPLFVELGPFTILFDLAFGLATGLISLGVDTINAEFTPDVYDALQCIFFCDIANDGTVSAEQLSTIEADIASQLSADVQLILGLMFLLMGNVGLTNAGATGDAPADCDACACVWCLEEDLQADEFAISAANIPDWGFGASYVPATGWVAALELNRGSPGEHASFFECDRLMPNAHYTHVEIDVNITMGDTSIIGGVIDVFLGDTLIFHIDSDTSGTLTWDGNIITSSGHLTLGRGNNLLGYNNTGGAAGGSGTWSRLLLKGTGTVNPFGVENNC